MKAIQTRFLGPTNTRGARVVAACEGKRTAVSFNYEGLEKAHDEAARNLASKMGWQGIWYRGGSIKGDGFVYVCAHLFDETKREQASVRSRYAGDLKNGAAVEL
jgi:hypothetical protein